ncbi:hypothetical protein [Sulfurospirillum deleyianum]|uniref:Uncharacterized protein n=1 Tax=Sulfurospirillum deleyianum (strain ATCC 51133 / DSM 6946 / 5175) TaxID=525898 RepID=D1AZW8_SULD5|nr:hypothetical protein [Sulfurospirillum deleyianum]ACZ11585.1 hypothetical protein Sdel_0549 [Sulfurospirillum deleyianum DSM 6946]
MNFYYVFTPDGISIQHTWSKVKAMINRVPNSGCQRIDNKPNLERWLEYVEKYCSESAINIFKNMIEEQNKNKSTKEIEIQFPSKLELLSKKGLRIVKKNTKK